MIDPVMHIYLLGYGYGLATALTAYVILRLHFAWRRWLAQPQPSTWACCVCTPQFERLSARATQPPPEAAPRTRGTRLQPWATLNIL